MQENALRRFVPFFMLLLGACRLGFGDGRTPSPPPRPIRSVTSHVVATLTAPWSLAFLPDGRMLVTERPPTLGITNPTGPGAVRLVTQRGLISPPIAGLPPNVGVLDILLDPAFARNGLVYASIMERDPAAPRIGHEAATAGIDPAGVAVVRLHIRYDAPNVATFDRAEVIWRQTKVVSEPGSGEPGGRMTFSPDGRYLFVASGDRQEFDLVQSLKNTLGKIIRIFPNGAVPSDNPFVDTAGARPEIWSLGHRNPYGLAFDAAGKLWENEMGPMGGDELNLIVAGANYGWPRVSYGDNYDGGIIPRPKAWDGFARAALSWTPVIAPAGMIFATGDRFAAWRGKAIIPGLQSSGLVLVHFEGDTATEARRIDLGNRIRAVAQGPDGALWILEDQPSGRLIRLDPEYQT